MAKEGEEEEEANAVRGGGGGPVDSFSPVSLSLTLLPLSISAFRLRREIPRYLYARREGNSIDLNNRNGLLAGITLLSRSRRLYRSMPRLDNNFLPFLANGALTGIVSTTYVVHRLYVF